MPEPKTLNKMQAVKPVPPRQQPLNTGKRPPLQRPPQRTGAVNQPPRRVNPATGYRDGRTVQYRTVTQNKVAPVKKKSRFDPVSKRDYLIGFIAGMLVFGIASVITCVLILGTVSPML